MNYSDTEVKGPIEMKVEKRKTVKKQVLQSVSPKTFPAFSVIILLCLFVAAGCAKGTVKAEFLRGVIFEERLTKCAYLNKHWNVSGNYKRL